MKRIMAIVLAAVFALSGCTALSAAEDRQEGNTVAQWFSDRDLDWTYDADEAVYITLTGESAECAAKEVEIDGGTVTIIDAGVFVVTGTLDDGMICVLCEKKDKVQIVLDDAHITSATCAPVYVHQADKVFITLADGTRNSLSNGGTFEQIDENNIDAVIFSKEDLTLNGGGSLNIDSPVGHGIVCKDDLAVTGGSYEIEAASHGISGKDSLAVTGCAMTIRSGKDGLRCESEEDEDKGNACIEGGSFSIRSGGDGLSASGDMTLNGGTFDIVSGGGSREAIQYERAREGFMGRAFQVSEESDSPSMKGIKAGGVLAVNGGICNIDACDDGIHSNGDIEVCGGSLAIATGDDGIHADNSLSVSGGSIDIMQSYEGLEAKDILVSGGEVSVVSDDDGFNAGGGKDLSGYGGRRGGDMFSSDGSSIAISGGNIYINAQGDGVDSNGSISVSGGYTVVCGPTGEGNGAMDYAGTADITGGVFVAMGSSRMAMNFSSAQDQGSVLVTMGDQEAGSQITLKDSAGETLITVTGDKDFSSAVISCPGIILGGNYTLTTGDETFDIAVESLITGSGSGMIGGRGGMGAGGWGPRGAGGFGGKGGW